MAKDDWKVVSEAPATAGSTSGWSVVSETPAPAATPVSTAATQVAEEPKKKEDSGFFNELRKGFQSAIEYGIPTMGRQLALQGSADAMVTRQKQLALMDKIASGEYATFDQVKADPDYAALKKDGGATTVNAFFANRTVPQAQEKLRSSTQSEFASMAQSTATQIDVLNKYAKESKAKYGPSVEKFTDINWTDPAVVSDFKEWLGYNFGSAGVQMLPIMLSAVVFKQPGLLAASGAMGVSEAVGNRLKFIQDQTKSLPPEQRGEAIAKYIYESGDTNLITGLVSGSFDLMLGPAASAAKTGLKGMIGQVGKGAAVKKTFKELPKDIGGEAVTGALQSATQIAAKKALEEEGKAITMENVKDVFNDAMAEAAGAPAGTAVKAGKAAIFTPSAPSANVWKVKSETPSEVDAYAAKLERQGFPSSEARRMAEAKFGGESEADREARLEREAIQAENEPLPGAQPPQKRNKPVISNEPPGVPTEDEIENAPVTLESLTAELINQGYPAAEARVLAQLYMARTEEQGAPDTGETQGEADVAGSDTPSTGSSPAVPAQSTLDVPAPAGVEGTQRDGVVSAGQDAGGTAAGEAEQPGAVTLEARLRAMTDAQLDEFLDDFLLNDTEYLAAKAEKARRTSTTGEPLGTQTTEAQQTETQGQEAAAPAALIKAIADVVRKKANIQFKQNKDGQYDLTANGVYLGTVPTRPASAQEALVPAAKRYMQMLEAAGEVLPTDPKQMTQDQFVAVNGLSKLVPEFEIDTAPGMEGSGLTVNADGTFSVDHDALYRRIQTETQNQEAAPAEVKDTFARETKDANGEIAAYDDGKGWRFTKRAVGQRVTFTDQGQTRTGVITDVSERQTSNGWEEVLKVTDDDPVSGQDDSGNPAPEKWTLTGRAISDVQPVETPARETSKSSTAAATSEPAKKRGRPAVLTPEEKAQRDADAKEDRKQREKHRRALAKLIPALKKATTAIDEGEFDNDEALKEAQADQRAERRAAVRDLLQISEEAGLKPAGKQARTALKEAGITDQEIADIKRGMEVTRKTLADKANVLGPVSSAMSGGTEANPAFSNATNAVQSLGVVLKGAASEALKRIARRLRSFNAGVKFQVIEVGDELPDVLKRHQEDWDASRGLFIQNDATGERMIFVKGASFGADQGANDITVVHENLHAATNQKLYLGLKAIENGFSLNSPLVKATRDMIAIMREAQARYFDLNDRGRAPVSINRLVVSTDGKIFGDVREFLAYGLSDPDFQQFLMNTRGKEVETSFFTRFVDSMRRLLGMAEDDTNALTDLIKATDDLLSARKTPAMRVLEQGDRRLAQLSEKNAEKVSAQDSSAKDDKEAKQAERQRSRMETLVSTLTPQEKQAWDGLNDEEKTAWLELQEDSTTAANKVKLSRLGTEAQGKGVELMQMARDPKKALKLLKGLWKSADYKKRQAMVKLPTFDVLAQWAEEAGIPRIKEVHKHIQEMNGMSVKFLEGAHHVLDTMRRTFRKLPGEQKAVEDLVLQATLSNFDPANPDTKVRSVKLDRAYNRLSPESQELYKMLRDYYSDVHDLFRMLLDDQVQNLEGVSADVKQNLMVMLRQAFEQGGRIDPFFPLVRRGDFWVSTGRGEGRQFYMFEDMTERDDFAERLRKTTKGEVKTGNDVGELRAATQESSNLLKAFFDAIDKQDLTDPQVKESLKDSVYQIYLQTMPEQSFRKMFIHRKGVTGFSTDLLRNTATTASRMSTQLARLKFAPILRRDVAAARSSIDERPELSPFIEEVQRRVNLSLSSKPGGAMEAVAGLANKASYIWYMSSASSALIQPFSIYISGLPILAANHGGNWAGAAMELGKMATFLNQYGITRKNADGTLSYTSPSLANNESLPEDERRAVQAMTERGVNEGTYASTVWGYSRVPSANIDSIAGKGARAADLLIGGLMHSTERLTREMVYLASYRLGKKRGLTTEEAIDQAVADTNEALSDYDISNRPTWMQKGLGKIAFQFKMYPLHMILLALTSFKKMLPFLNKEGKLVAAQKFFGLMGTSATLAGVSNMLFFSPIMSLIGWAWKQLEDDDELPEELRQKSFETWFRTVFLPEKLGDTGAAIVDRGMLNYVTGWDVGSRTGLNDLWGRDSKETKTARDSAIAFVIDNFGGPTVSLGLNMIDAYEAYALGDYQRAVEKATPSLIRNVIIANKYADEGIKTARGAELVPKEALTKGELFGQAIGFRPDRAAYAQQQAFKLTGIEQKVLNQRDMVMRKLNVAYKKGDDESFEKLLETEVDQFNRKNPTYAIKADDIRNSIRKQVEQRESAQAGVNVTKKNAVLVQDALENIQKTLEKPVPQK